MKLPSLDELALTTRDTLKRFPLPLVSALVFALLCWLVIDEVDGIEAGHVFAAVLGISLFFGIDLLSERIGSRSLRILLWILGAAGLITYGLIVGKTPKDNVTEIYRFGLFLIAVHLFVAVAPFIRKGSVQAFWEFNKSLFLRLLLALLFSGVLFGGLAVALLAIDQLLLGGDVIEEVAYAKLFIVIGSLFTTLFFLAGVPEDVASLEEEREYPKGLKIFAQNLLLPLVVLYMAILYVYAASILVKWELPEGWVGWLVLSFSVLGILALLLLHPLRKREESAWIVRFTRWFYVAVLPLIALLFAAIITRIAEYGVTENRYFVVLLACWLGGIAIYFIASRRKNIQIIPISLCLVALFSSFGPWSAFSVSAQSQADRFEELVRKNDMLVNGKIDPVKGEEADTEDKNEMTSILSYLSEHDELDRITPFVEGDVDGEGGWTVAEKIGISSSVSGQNIFWFTEKVSDLVDVSDIREFDFVMRHRDYSTSGDERTMWRGDHEIMWTTELEGTRYLVAVRPVDPELLVVRNDTALVRFDLDSMITAQLQVYGDAAGGSVELGTEERTIAGTGGKGKVIVEMLSGRYEKDDDGGNVPDEITLESLRFTLLLGGLSGSQAP